MNDDTQCEVCKHWFPNSVRMFYQEDEKDDELCIDCEWKIAQILYYRRKNRIHSKSEEVDVPQPVATPAESETPKQSITYNNFGRLRTYLKGCHKPVTVSPNSNIFRCAFCNMQCRMIDRAKKCPNSQ